MRRLPMIGLVLMVFIFCFIAALIYHKYVGIKSNLEECTDQLRGLQGSLEESVHKNLELTTALEEKSRKLAELGKLAQPPIEEECKKELERLRGECSREVRKLKETIDDLESSKRNAEAELEKVRESLEEEISRLRENLESKDREFSIMLQRVYETGRKLESMKRELDNCVALQAKEREQLMRLERERSEMARTAEDVKRAYEEMREELKDEIQKREASIRILKERISVSIVERLLFQFGRSTLTPEGKEKLKKLCKPLSLISGREIQVVGHTDPTPIKEEFRYRFPSNWELSTARASTVVRFLESQCGVNPRLLRAAGRAHHEPMASNDLEEGRAQNRRVEIVIGPKLEEFRGSPTR